MPVGRDSGVKRGKLRSMRMKNILLVRDLCVELAAKTLSSSAGGWFIVRTSPHIQLSSHAASPHIYLRLGAAK